MVSQRDKELRQLDTEQSGTDRVAMNAAHQAAQQFQGEEGKKLLVRLVACAVSLAGNKVWRNLKGLDGEHSELAKGMAPEDIVTEVIEDVLTGKRKWNPSKGELEPWLKEQIRSEMSHLLDSKEHKYERENLAEIDKVHRIESTVSDKTGITDPASILLDHEERAEVQRRINALFEVVDGEPDLEEVVMAIADGCEDKPRFLAKELGIETSEVNNRLKRLRRRMKNRGV